MAKHYEALQRAETERRRKATGSESAAPGASAFEGAAITSPAQKEKAGIFTRVFGSGRGAGGEAPSDANKRRISLLQPDSYVAEQYRSLRGRLDSLASQRPLKTIAVTSANAGESSRPARSTWPP